ncbi:MAG: penicillin-binding protein activator [Deltaproteobacteria bacterium]|nr:penicillin-binding protein activator [Deltaproteobacteria bacterium]
MYRKITSALLLCSALVVGCASAPKRSSANDSGNSGREEALDKAKSQNTPDGREFAAMDAEYRKHNFDNMIKRSKVFLKTYPKSDFLDEVYNLRGLALIGLKQYAGAAAQLKKALELSSNDSLKNMASYNLAYVYFELGQIDAAAQALEGMKPSSLEKNDRVKYFILRAKIARLKQDYAGSAQDILSGIHNIPEAQNQMLESMLAFLDEVLEPINNLPSLERLLADHDDGPGADRLYYKVGAYYFGNGERDKAKKFFQKIVESYPESRYYATARDNLRKVEFQGVVDPKRIGVVLTLSGKFGKFGYKALQGLELALKIFQPAGEPNPVSLVVLDDQGDQERALAAMDDLFFKHHVAVIVGPLVSKLAEPMGKKAQELGIPLVTLSQKEAQAGDYVFNAALTPAMQVRELVQYAAEKAGVTSFAMLSPTGKFGEEYVKAFWDEVDRTGGSVRGCETYANDETDFRQYVDKLVGLAQLDARSHEVEELKLLKAATPIKSRSKKFERMFDLKPIVDFQAVFIPDEPKALGQILPTFAYRDVEKTLFLGINTWNNPDLIARAGQFAEGAVFVDGFYPGSHAPSSKKFSEEFRATFNADPSPLEAMAYDAGHILATLMRSGDVSSRTEMRDRILGLRDFQGVTGKISYRDGRLTKHLSLLTVKGGKIDEIAFQ